MPYYDIDAVLKDANSLDVAEELGMEIVKKGTKYYIPCPGHEKRLGKPDSNIGNCVLTEKGYHCYACDVYVGMVQMVMEYTELPFGKAIGIIANANGNPKRYLLKGKANKETVKEERMPLNKDELVSIGLFPENKHSAKVITCACDMEDDGLDELMESHPHFDKEIYYDQKEDAFTRYLFYEFQPTDSLTDLFLNDRQVFYQLVCQKASETMAGYQNLLDNYAKRNAPNFNIILDVLKGPDGYLDDTELYYLKEAIKERYDAAKQILYDYKDYLPVEERIQYQQYANL